MEPVYDPCSALVYAMKSHKIEAYMICGEWVMKERGLLKVKEEEIVLEKVPLSVKNG